MFFFVGVRIMKKPYIAVAGGVNVDIGGRSFAPLRSRDSNPGQVRVSLGGVGRNIAHNLRLLGAEVTLLTALGDDANGRRIEASCQKLGIDLTHALRLPDAATSTYLYLNDHNGDMALALSDMEIVDKLTPDYFAGKLDVLSGAELVVIDANLSAESLAFLAEHCTAPLFADPVSAVKGEKLKPILGKLHTLKPNRLEAEALSGVKITNWKSLDKAAETLLETGLKRVFITLGDKGCLAAEPGVSIARLSRVTGVKNATGGGDAFTAALAWAWLEGKDDLEESMRLAQAAAAIAVEGGETINPALSARTVLERMKSEEDNL